MSILKAACVAGLCRWMLAGVGLQTLLYVAVLAAVQCNVVWCWLKKDMQVPALKEVGKTSLLGANYRGVKLVWYYNNALGRPEKKKFIARAKSYHGSTLIAASLSGLPALHQKFDLPVSFVLHADCLHYWCFHLPGETEEEFATRLVNNLENLILKEGPETIAAFIVEPVMGAGGVILPPATYFEKVQAIVKKYDIFFIADEVITAFGRLGTMFGCDKEGQGTQG